MDALAGYRLSKPEFVQVKARDGFVMEAMMIKPPDFDPSKRYPVYQFTYGGPHSQQVKNVWQLQNMYHQLLAQQGIIVWICDNRTASGKGVESTWPVFKHFGEVELRDIEDGVSWLKQQPYVDGSRIGIHGWSYGGFMTTYALTHSTSFVDGNRRRYGRPTGATTTRSTPNASWARRRRTRKAIATARRGSPPRSSTARCS